MMEWFYQLSQQRIGTIGFRKRLHQTVIQTQPLEITMEQVEDYWRAPFYQRWWIRFWNNDIIEKEQLLQMHRQRLLLRQNLSQNSNLLQRLTQNLQEHSVGYYIDHQPAAQIAEEIYQFDNTVTRFRRIRSWWQNIPRKRLQMLYILTADVSDAYYNHNDTFSQKQPEFLESFNRIGLTLHDQGGTVHSLLTQKREQTQSIPATWSFWHVVLEQEIRQWQNLSITKPQGIAFDSSDQLKTQLHAHQQQGFFSRWRSNFPANQVRAYWLQQESVALLESMKDTPELITPTQLPQRLRKLEQESDQLNRWSPNRKKIRTLIWLLRQHQFYFLQHRNEIVSSIAPESSILLSADTQQRLLTMQPTSKQAIPTLVKHLLQWNNPKTTYETLETELERQLHGLLLTYLEALPDLDPNYKKNQAPQSIESTLQQGTNKCQTLSTPLEKAIEYVAQPIPGKLKSTRSDVKEQLAEKDHALQQVLNLWDTKMNMVSIFVNCCK